MINLRPGRIYLANEPVDMRKSFDTLADLVRFGIGQNPESGDAFVFIGKRRNRLKVLFWEDSGYWLCAKRLESGTFPLGSIVAVDGRCATITLSQWHNLLEGIVILSSRKLKRFRRRETA